MGNRLSRSLPAALLFLVACAQPPAPAPTQSAAPAATATSSPAAAEHSWKRIDLDPRPSPRVDYSLAGDDRGIYLFGGKSSGEPLGDLWFFDPSAPSWRRIDAPGPDARFGHNAVVKGGRLQVFGGQARGDTFFDDLWEFDPASQKWTRLSAGKAPARRYGAGGTLAEGAFIISHGFTFSGRFDDTWSLGASWMDVSPSSGTRPVKRCLHRIAYLGAGKVLLFGGQTNGNPFLGDTWIYQTESRSWNKLDVAGPSARTLFALAASGGKAYLFGGRSSDGPKGDLWTFDGQAWKAITATGESPSARSGIEAAISSGKLYVFGGKGDKEMDDLWELTIP